MAAPHRIQKRLDKSIKSIVDVVTELVAEVAALRAEVAESKPIEATLEEVEPLYSPQGDLTLLKHDVKGIKNTLGVLQAEVAEFRASTLSKSAGRPRKKVPE